MPSQGSSDALAPDALAPELLIRARSRDLILIGLGVAGVSTSAPLIKLAAVPALAIAFWRNALGALVFLPYLAASTAQRRQLGSLTRREVGWAILSGAILAAHFATWIPSLSYTSVAASVALVATQPIWTALMARVRGRQVSAIAWVGIGVALCGTIAVTGVDLSVSSRAVLGDLLALAGGVLAAAYFTVGAAVRRTVTTTVYTSICYSVAAALLLVGAIGGGRSLSGYSPRSWWYIVALTCGAQLLGHSVFNRVLRNTSATLVSVAILFEVVGAILLAAWWFGEPPPARTLPAAGFIMFGVVLVALAGPRAGSSPSLAGLSRLSNC